MDNNTGASQQENKIGLGPLAKDGEKLMKSIESGNMVALLSQNELLYCYKNDFYQCYIHPLAAEEGRCKSFEVNTQTTAMIKNLATLADQIFEITFQKDMNYLGVMAAAETGIINFLDMTGNLPADDFDFISGETPSN